MKAEEKTKERVDYLNNAEGWIDQYQSERRANLILENEAIDLKEKLDKIYSGVFLEVSIETTNGKPTFTNKDTREAETDARLLKHKEYQDVSDALALIQEEISQAKISIDTLYLRIGLYKAFLRGGD